ncbi:ABC transporter substrate-binding protein [Gilvimarinus sp. SDUM040013]|uniref:ABC transporter substrate-binding protein n=1 Tax=Gilvimarinus gilvus TaxID=3058038 RepID=A0ABU4RSK9_9GAMM|nr:ABC transporter substrate-binding protein [Gilvimarinus sp. SDUM040013]MDO3388345.1 ABC transporter substrate-binding protein [Gilvimarinus sp. SDUM040013]MDX6847895.1 ABC transporter substrate-binding protein [Gilvimarinus sp. SDUM040013]
MSRDGLKSFIGRLGMWFSAALFTVAVNAQASDPYAIVEKVTGELVSAAQAQNTGGNKADYDAKVLKALEPVVAFDYIARVVMGDYYDAASAEQQVEFAEKFKAGLVASYAKGIANYADSDIQVLTGEPVGDKRRITVDQEVKHQGSVHKLSYTMGKNKQGEWKLINVVLNGANLGTSFVSQFEQLAQKYGGDVAKVIANWDASDV